MNQALKIFLIVLAILAVIVVLLVLFLPGPDSQCDPNNPGFQLSGKPDINCKPVVQPSPGNDPVLPDDQQLKDQVMAVSKELFDTMDGGFTTSGDKDKAWQGMISLPDSQVRAVYAYFNFRYGQGDTLTQWIKDEKYYDYLSGIKQLAIDRLEKLGLK